MNADRLNTLETEVSMIKSTTTGIQDDLQNQTLKEEFDL